MTSDQGQQMGQAQRRDGLFSFHSPQVQSAEPEIDGIGLDYFGCIAPEKYGGAWKCTNCGAKKGSKKCQDFVRTTGAILRTIDRGRRRRP